VQINRSAAAHELLRGWRASPGSTARRSRESGNAGSKPSVPGSPLRVSSRS
jgi:hypothetical protein